MYRYTNGRANSSFSRAEKPCKTDLTSRPSIALSPGREIGVAREAEMASGSPVGRGA